MSEQGRKLDPAAKRNLILLGGAVGVGLVAVGSVFFMATSGKDKTGPTGSVDLAVVNDQGVEPRTGPMSPSQEQAVRTAQMREAEAALRRGQSYFPADQVNAPVPVGQVEPTPSLEQTSIAATGAHQGLSPEQSRELERQRAGLERQINAMLSQGGAPRVERVTFNAEKQPAAPVQPVAQSTAQSSDPAPAEQRRGALVADALEIFAAVSTSPVDTYKTNYASARIVSGPLAGAFLIGTAQPMEEGLSIEYTMMRHAGKTYQVSAIALDEATATNAVSANVDRRIFQRFVLPIVLAGTQGYHQARSQTGSTVVGIPSGIGDDVAGVTTPAPTREQARSAGIAKGLEIAGNEVQKEAAKPLRFTMENNTPMGIMFRAPVRETVN